jgi:carboxymethylenebutenolidase
VSQHPALIRDEQKLANVWDEHLRAEFEARSVDETLATMVANPRVHLAPVMLGGNGKEEVSEFYERFMSQIPKDTEIIPVSRTVGQGRVVEEIIFGFTHDIPMTWMLPGIPPTGKRVEIALLIVIQFDGDKMAHEHLYWDQASVLVQLGVLAPGRLPVVGAESARSIMDRSIPLNGLLHSSRGTAARCSWPIARSSTGGAFKRVTDQRDRA